jgi:hypothetical protein
MTKKDSNISAHPAALLSTVAVKREHHFGAAQRYDLHFQMPQSGSVALVMSKDQLHYQSEQAFILGQGPQTRPSSLPAVKLPFFDMTSYGMTTDFNSGLLLIVMVLACWPTTAGVNSFYRAREEVNFRQLGHRSF